MNTTEVVKEKVQETTNRIADGLETQWNTVKGQLKQKYGQLTDDDLVYAKGKEEELYGRLQKKLNVGRDELTKVINSFMPKS